MHHSSVCAIHYQYTIGTLHTIDMIYTLYIRDIYVILDLYGDYRVATYTAVCIKLSVYSLLSFCSTYNTRDTTTPQSRTGLWRGLGSQRYYASITWSSAQDTLGDRGGAITHPLLKEPLVAFSSSFCLPLLAFFS